MYKKFSYMHVTSILLVGVAGAVFVMVFSLFVPYNMDEFSFYHTILCAHYAYNTLNTYIESCSNYHLSILGVTLPLRSFYYTGNLNALLYYPVFLLVPSPLSARWIGFLALMVQAAVLSNLFRMQWKWLFLGLLAFFPYSFAHIIDTGPVTYHTTSCFVGFWLLSRWAQRMEMRYLIATALLFVLGVWAKLNGLWLLPAFGAMTLLALILHKRLSLQYCKTICVHFFFAILVGITGLSLYLFASVPGEPTSFPLLSELMDAEKKSFTEVVTTFSTLPSMRFLFHPLEAVHRVLQPKPIAVFDTLALLAFVLLVPLGISAYLRKDRCRALLMPLTFYGIFGLTLLVIATTQRSSAIHHIVLAFPFLILAVCSLEGIMRHGRGYVCRFWNIALIGVLELFAVYFALLPGLDAQPRSISHDNAIIEALQSQQLAEDFVYVVTQWGLYYHMGLYGDDNHGVIHVYDISEDMLYQLEETARKNQKHLLFVYIENSGFDVGSGYHHCHALTGTDHWNIAWQDGAQQNPCAVLEKHQKAVASI